MACVLRPTSCQPWGLSSGTVSPSLHNDPDSNLRTTIRGDGHVHLYPAFDRDLFFRTALMRTDGGQGPFLLMLTERSAESAFLELRDAARRSPEEDRLLLIDHTVEITAEPLSLRIRGLERGPAEPALFMVCGRQFKSREGLEVAGLALDPADPLYGIKDRELAAADLVQRLLDLGVAAGLPWGVGKWLGDRRREVERLIALPRIRDHRLFFLGDIAARCRPWPEPRAFHGRRILAGSDVLPLPGHEKRLASYGFELASPVFDPARPAAAFLAALEAADTLDVIGKRQSMVTMMVDQIRYRLRRGESR